MTLIGSRKCFQHAVDSHTDDDKVATKASSDSQVDKSENIFEKHKQ